MKQKKSNNMVPENSPLEDGIITHIVFQQADITVLQQAIALDKSLQGNITIIRDDYAVGPIKDIFEPDGYQQRRDWWKELLDGSPYPTEELMNIVDDRLAVQALKKELEENEHLNLWIWMGQNQHDVCGYYWLISQLKEYAGRIQMLYLNNLPFINERGHIFYPTTLHQIQPKEFLKAKKMCRKITAGEIETDADEWNRLSNENAMIRILEGGKKIVSKDAGFYDEDILKGLTFEWQRGHRAMHTILAKMKLKTGDVFLLWRIKALATEDKVALNGDPAKGWKEFEVKLKTTVSAEASV